MLLFYNSTVSKVVCILYVIPKLTHFLIFQLADRFWLVVRFIIRAWGHIRGIKCFGESAMLSSLKKCAKKFETLVTYRIVSVKVSLWITILGGHSLFDSLGSRWSHGELPFCCLRNTCGMPELMVESQGVHIQLRCIPQCLRGPQPSANSTHTLANYGIIK